MLVDVVLMRRNGVKVPVEQLREIAIVRGHLRLKTVPWRAAYSPNLPMVSTVFASLHADAACQEPTMLRALRDARIERLEGDSFVVLGLDNVGEYMREVDYPQAWAWHLVTPGS